MTTIRIFALYVNGYLNNLDFEKWIYQNLEELNNCIENDIFLELLETNFTDKKEQIHLKHILDNYLYDKHNDILINTTDSYIEKIIDNNSDDFIIKCLNKIYLQDDSIVIDCSMIRDEYELQCILKKNSAFLSIME